MMMKNRLAKGATLGLFVLVLGGADQWLKQIGEVVAKSNRQWGPITFTWYENPGIAFSIDLPTSVAIGLVVIILMILIKLFWLYQGKSWLYLLGLILVISGGVSNLVDKVRLGYVRDFVEIWWLPIFNLADVMIFVGLIIIVVNIGYGERNKKI